MDKKKILLIVAVAVIIVIVAVISRYMAMRQPSVPADTAEPVDTFSQTERPPSLTPDFVPVAVPDGVRATLPAPTSETPLPSETPSSFGGTITAVDGEKVTITKKDGTAVDYAFKTLVGIYDNRVAGTIKPLKKADITVGMAVRVLYTLNQSDKTDVIDLMVYEK